MNYTPQYASPTYYPYPAQPAFAPQPGEPYPQGNAAAAPAAYHNPWGAGTNHSWNQYAYHTEGHVPNNAFAAAAPPPAPPAFNPWSDLFADESLPPLQEPAGKASPDTPAKKTIRLVTNILTYLIVAAIVAGGAIFALSNNPKKSYFGYRLYTVKTPSMTPRKDGTSTPGGFRAGDTILVKVTNDPSAIKVGDIVTFVPGRDPDVYLTHRVVQVLDRLNQDEGLFFVTRGDANDSDDAPIKGESVIGVKVMAIRGTGGILQFIQNNTLLSVVIISSGIGLIIMIRIYFSLPKSKKKKDAKLI